MPSSGTALPFSPVAVPDHVYVCAYFSGCEAVQWVRSSDSVPSTAAPCASRRATSAKLPLETRTAIGAIGFTPVAPGPGS